MRFSIYSKQDNVRTHHEIETDSFEELFVAAEIDASRDDLGCALIFNDRADIDPVASVHVQSKRRPYERGTVCTQWVRF